MSSGIRLSNEPQWNSDFSCMYQCIADESTLQNQWSTFRVVGKLDEDSEIEEVLGSVKLDMHTLLTGPAQQNMPISRFVNASSMTVQEQKSKRRKSALFGDTNLPQVQRASYLFRRGRTLNKWQRRWYVCSELRGVWSLIAYKDPSMSDIIKEMDFNAVTVAERCEVAGRPACFQLVFDPKEGKKKTLLLSAESESDAEAWIQFCNSAIALKQGKQPAQVAKPAAQTTAVVPSSEDTAANADGPGDTGATVEDIVGRLAFMAEIEPMLQMELYLRNVHCIFWNEPETEEGYYLQYAYSGASRSAMTSEPATHGSWRELQKCEFKASLRELLNEALLLHVRRHPSGDLVATASLALVRCPVGVALAKFRFFEPLVVLSHGREVGELLGTLELNHDPILSQMAGGVNSEKGISRALPLLAGLSWPRHATGGLSPFPEGRGLRAMANHIEGRLADFFLHFSYDRSLLTKELCVLLSFYRMMGFCVPEMVSYVIRSGVSKGMTRSCTVLTRPLSCEGLLELTGIISTVLNEIALFVESWNPPDVADDLPRSGLIMALEVRNFFRGEIQDAFKNPDALAGDRRTFQKVLSQLQALETSIDNHCIEAGSEVLPKLPWKILERGGAL